MRDNLAAMARRIAVCILGIALAGCGAAGPTSDTLVRTLAPLAAEALAAAARDRGVDIDQGAAWCIEVPEVPEVPGVLAMCWAPEVEQ